MTSTISPKLPTANQARLQVKKAEDARLERERETVTDLILKAIDAEKGFVQVSELSQSAIDWLEGSPNYYWVEKVRDARDNYTWAYKIHWVEKRPEPEEPVPESFYPEEVSG